MKSRNSNRSRNSPNTIVQFAAPIAIAATSVFASTALAEDQSQPQFPAAQPSASTSAQVPQDPAHGKQTGKPSFWKGYDDHTDFDRH